MLLTPEDGAGEGWSRAGGAGQPVLLGVEASPVLLDAPLQTFSLKAIFPWGLALAARGSPALCADPWVEAERCSSVPRAIILYASPPNHATASAASEQLPGPQHRTFQLWGSRARLPDSQLQP